MRSASAILLTLGLLSGCGGGPTCCVDGGGGGAVGGGSGDGGGGVVRPTPDSGFLSFRETDEGETLRAAAIVQRSNGGADYGGRADFRFDDDERFDLLDVSGAGTAAAWSEGELRCSGTRCLLRDGDDPDRNVGRVTLPGAFDWNYQTFGYWIDDRSSSGRVATAFSMGNPTPAGAEISRSSASYDGRARGVYTDGGDIFETDARMSARVDFRDREIDFSTSSTRLTSVGSDRYRSAGRLDMEGTLTIGDGYRFSGQVETERSLEGTATGTFYGPDAQEIGGTFSLGGGDETLTGAFGGRRR